MQKNEVTPQPKADDQLIELTANTAKPKPRVKCKSITVTQKLLIITVALGACMALLYFGSDFVSKEYAKYYDGLDASGVSKANLWLRHEAGHAALAWHMPPLAATARSTMLGGFDSGVMPLPTDAAACRWSAASAGRNGSHSEASYHLAAMIAARGGIVAEELASKDVHSVRADRDDAQRHALLLLKACGHPVFGPNKVVLSSAMRMALNLVRNATKTARSYLEVNKDGIENLMLAFQKEEFALGGTAMESILGPRDEVRYGYGLDACSWIDV